MTRLTGVEVGTIVFTMVDPDPGYEVAYNRWYERDHFYAGCMAFPWTFSGGRFVATRGLKDLRYPAVSEFTPDRGRGSYLALYWIMAGRHDEWAAWAVPATERLYAEGRMFEHRTHVHTNLYQYEWSARRRPDGCPVELALDHRYPALVVVAGDVSGDHDHAEVERWFRSVYLPGALSSPWGPDLVASTVVHQPIQGAPVDWAAVNEPSRRFVQLHFLDHDPVKGWRDGYGRIGEAIEASGVASHAWTAPFVRTEVGSDRYANELW